MSEETYDEDDWLELKNTIARIRDMNDYDLEESDLEELVKPIEKAKRYIETQLDIKEGTMYMKSAMTDIHYRVYAWIERGNGLFMAIIKREVSEKQYKQALMDEYTKSWSEDTGESEESMPLEPEEVFKHAEEKRRLQS